MSGGVDSSIAAFLLKEAGHEIIGVTLRFYKESCSNELRVCCSPEDVKDAAYISERLGIPHITLDWEKLFEQRVIQYFVEGYMESKTPNPCAICNRDVKTGYLARYLRKVADIDRFATGHYARTAEHKGRRLIRRGKDISKDQSYFLALIKKEDIDLLEFPIGSMSKEEVRKTARLYKLPVAEKKDSQEVCFLMGRAPGDFIEAREGVREGLIVHKEGHVLGKHRGTYHFTVGQRRGLGISHHRPLYVLQLKGDENKVIVGYEEDLYRDTILLKDVNFHLPLEEWEDVYAVVRYRSQPVRIRDVQRVKDDYLIKLERPVKNISPGQVCAFYDGDVLLGGGIIELIEAR